MAPYHRQIKQAQHRLWINRGLRQWGWTLTFATIAWVGVWVADRLLTLHWPMSWLALGGVAISLVAAAVWLAITREELPRAATALDEAAGLKERVSSGLYAEQSNDPFGQAVIADAERAVAGLSAGRFIPIRWASSLSLSGIVLVIALLSLLLPEFDLLNKKESVAKAQADQAKIDRIKQVTAKPVTAIQEVLQKHPELEKPPALKELDDALRRMDTKDADVMRRESIKQLDRLKDALKKQVDSERFAALNETKKRLKKIGEAEEPQNDAQKLMSALAEGNFQEAQEALKKMQEQLAQRPKKDQQEEQQKKEMEKKLEEMSEKLEEAAKKLDEAGKDKQSQQELQNQGMSKEQAEKTLQKLANADKKQLEKMAQELAQQLKDKGVTKEQMQQMLEKMQQKQKGCQQCQKMGQAMQQAAQKMKEGDKEGAGKEMQKAGEQLNEMEMMEQALKDLETQMSKLDQAKEDLGEKEIEEDPYKDQDWQKQDGQGNSAGRGAGKRDRNDNVETDTVDKQAKVKKRQGAIIGQQYVKGPQLKGESQAEFYDAAAAAELEATDALNRDRVPRAYRKGVKNYFDRLPKDFAPAEKGKDGVPAATSQPS